MPIIGRGNGKGTRATKVRRAPYWRPDIEQWTFVPVDLTHDASVEMNDPETGEIMGRTGVYESKGWQHFATIPPGDERHKLLPTNYREMMGDHKAVAQMPKVGKADAA